MQNTNPDFSKAIDRALQASRINDSATAIAQFQEAAKLDPNSAIPHFLLGAEYIENKQIAYKAGSVLTFQHFFVFEKTSSKACSKF